MSTPPDGWLPPQNPGQPWPVTQKPTDVLPHPTTPTTGGWPAPTAWPPPTGRPVGHPAYGYAQAPAPRNSPARTGVALLIILALVLTTIFGIGAFSGGLAAVVAPSYNGGSSATVPEPLTTPSVLPDSDEHLLRNPPSPPRWAVPSTDPGTGDWKLSPWPWDVLPRVSTETDDEWSALQSVSLAELPVPSPVSCPVPTTITGMDAYEAEVRRQWHCMHEAWRPILAQLGANTDEPRISFYDAAAGVSACGKVEAPAFYCPLGKGTAHFGRDDMEVAGYWDLSIQDTVGHEYVHHLQSVTGIMEAVDRLPYTSDLDRRVELQASCLSSAMTAHTDTVEFDERRWEQWHDNVYEMLPDAEHGSSASLRYWSFRGLYAKTVGDCNTWTVDPERVS